MLTAKLTAATAAERALRSLLPLLPLGSGMNCGEGGTDMTLVQRIARQALLTFRSPSRPAEEENLTRLRNLMTEVRASDLKLAPRRAEHAGNYRYQPGSAPVTYMHIYETDGFSMGVFLLKSGTSIPLHDHPDMFGLLKVLYGKARISCFDRLDRDRPGGDSRHVGAVRRSVTRSCSVFTEESSACLLSPDRNNLHQIDAVDGPTAFMDILAPPYDPDQGRDCQYYRVVSESGPAELQQEVWLKEVSQPQNFWCGSEPYPGPEVHL